MLRLDKRYHPDFSRPGKQLLGPVKIDWLNPLTRGLTYAFLPRNGVMENIVRGGANGTPFDSNAKIGVSKLGKTGICVNSAFEVDTLTTGINTSFFTKLERTDDGERDSIVCAEGTIFALNWRMNGGGGTVQAFVNAGVGGSVTSTGTVATGDIVTLGMTMNQAEANPLRLFIDGALDGSASGSALNTGGPLKIGAKGDFGTLNTSTNAEYEYVFIWGSRGLPDEDFARLHADPYQIFKPASAPVYFTPSVAPAAGSILLINRSIANYGGIRQ